MVSNPMMRQHIGVPYPAGQARKRQISLYFPVDQGNWGNTETGSLETASSSKESRANSVISASLRPSLRPKHLAHPPDADQGGVDPDYRITSLIGSSKSVVGCFSNSASRGSLAH
jgi:hypothetical protein